MASQVRVRFAPSPTGIPHVGNIRTALFNWLFARHMGGSFIVRIEDTDQARTVEGATEAIFESLLWLGLDWDEGPEIDGDGFRGDYGPYRQSLRRDLYKKYTDQLVETGDAYLCSCTPERLDEMRKSQREQGLPPGYDRHCRNLLDAERPSGGPQVVRFKVPNDGETAFDDLVRGPVSFQNAVLDDFVIMKSDGFPTYHLANVVDDHLMAISHVLRAEEWLPSTPRHVLLYRALGWEPSVFAHLPMILGPDRSKMSKRHGATSLLEYRDKGFLPEAVLNFLVLLGWSLDDKTELFSRDELVNQFDLARVTKAGAIFNMEKLEWMNGTYLRGLSPQALAERMIPYLENDLPSQVPRPLSGDYVGRIVPLVQERLKTLQEAAVHTEFFFVEDVAPDSKDLVQKGMDPTGAIAALETALARLEALSSFDGGPLEAVLRPLAEELGLKTGKLFGTLRVATTGGTAAPPLFETMEVLGRDRCLARIRVAIAVLQG
jgi:glutamyl-tRNA synthetase